MWRAIDLTLRGGFVVLMLVTLPWAQAISLTDIPLGSKSVALAGTASQVDCMAPPPSGQNHTLVVAYAASPPAIDEVAFTMEVENMLHLAYAGDLVQYKQVWWPETGTCGAALNLPPAQQITGLWAQSWSSSSDGTVWTFRLKRGIRSHFGNEMTCEDHRWTWERGFALKTVQHFMAGVMGLPRAENVSCPDKYTVRFKINAFNPLFLHTLALKNYSATFDSKEAKKHATSSDPYAKEWLKNHTAGFGPFHMLRHVPGQELELVRNPNYRPRPAISRILIKVIPDSATRLALLKRGQVDYAMRLREREYREVANDPQLTLFRHTGNFIPYFGPVQTSPIMANLKVRQALAYAVPYEDIHQKVYFGQGHVMKSITPRINPASTAKFWPYTTNLDRAKQLLTEAGYPNGFNLTISYDKAIQEMEEVCTLIKSNLEKIGIKVKLEGLPAAVYSETKYTGKQMAHCDSSNWPYITDTGYTAWNYVARAGANFINAVQHKDLELDRLTARMMQMPFGTERSQLDQRVQQLVGEKVPWILLVNPGAREAFRKGWKGYHWYPDNNAHFEWLYK